MDDKARGFVDGDERGVLVEDGNLARFRLRYRTARRRGGNADVDSGTLADRRRRPADDFAVHTHGAGCDPVLRDSPRQPADVADTTHDDLVEPQVRVAAVGA